MSLRNMHFKSSRVNVGKKSITWSDGETSISMSQEEQCRREKRRIKSIVYEWMETNSIADEVRGIMVRCAHLPTVDEMMSWWRFSGKALHCSCKQPASWSYELSCLFSEKMNELALRIAEYEKHEVDAQVARNELLPSYAERMEWIRIWLLQGISPEDIVASRHESIRREYVGVPEDKSPKEIKIQRVLGAIRVMIFRVKTQLDNKKETNETNEDEDSFVSSTSSSSSRSSFPSSSSSSICLSQSSSCPSLSP